MRWCKEEKKEGGDIYCRILLRGVAKKRKAMIVAVAFF
jgi:hypothetical protein